MKYKFLSLLFLFFALAWGGGAMAADKSRISLEDVEILQAVKVIGRATGRTFVFNAKDLKGKKITILSTEEFTSKEIMKIFETVLAVNNLTLIHEAGVDRILPVQEAKTGMPPISQGKQGGAFVTRVIHIRHLNVRAVRAALAPLISKTAILVQVDNANTLMLKDTKENTERFAEMVRIIDQPGGERLGPEIVRLRYASAIETAQLISKIYETNNKNNNTLNVFSDRRTNSLILVGLPSTIAAAKGLLLKLDRESKQGGNIRVFPLKSANAGEVAKVMEKFTRDLQAKKTAQGKNISISVIADVPSNSLIIFADASDFETLEQVIGQLDIPRAQVFIQALIMEIKLDKSLDLGVEWQAGKIVNEGKDTEALVTLGGVGSTGGPKKFPATVTGGAQVGIVGGPISFGGQQFSSFNAFIRATQQDSEIDILSNPQILTLNNEEAEIKVGEVIPTLGTTKVDVQGNETTTIEYKEVGVSMKITPQINADGTVELRIEEQSSNLVEGKANALGTQGAITTLNRSLKTKVVVQDGQTIALGGLISDEKTAVELKTPCLGDIPILGWFFKTRNTTTRKTNLMIFLTPKIVRNAQELSEVSHNSKLKLRNARNNRFRIDVSKEYNIPEVNGGGSDQYQAPSEPQIFQKD